MCSVPTLYGMIMCFLFSTQTNCTLEMSWSWNVFLSLFVIYLNLFSDIDFCDNLSTKNKCAYVLCRATVTNYSFFARGLIFLEVFFATNNRTFGIEILALCACCSMEITRRKITCAFRTTSRFFSAYFEHGFLLLTMLSNRQTAYVVFLDWHFMQPGPAWCWMSRSTW